MVFTADTVVTVIFKCLHRESISRFSFLVVVCGGDVRPAVPVWRLLGAFCKTTQWPHFLSQDTSHHRSSHHLTSTFTGWDISPDVRDTPCCYKKTLLLVHMTTIEIKTTTLVFKQKIFNCFDEESKSHWNSWYRKCDWFDEWYKMQISWGRQS